MEELGKEHVTLSLHSDNQSAIDHVNNQPIMTESSTLMCGTISSISFERRCVITDEDTYESESRRHADQGGHAEKLKTCSASVGLLG